MHSVSKGAATLIGLLYLLIGGGLLSISPLISIASAWPCSEPGMGVCEFDLVLIAVLGVSVLFIASAVTLFITASGSSPKKILWQRIATFVPLILLLVPVVTSFLFS